MARVNELEGVIIAIEEIAQLQAQVNELEGAVATVKEATMANLREVKSLKKSVEVVRIDKDRTYQRALKADVDLF